MTSILRQRMLEAMVLSGKAARTQEAYIGAVFGLARHYHRNPRFFLPYFRSILIAARLACSRIGFCSAVSGSSPLSIR